MAKERLDPLIKSLIDVEGKALEAIVMHAMQYDSPESAMSAVRLVRDRCDVIMKEIYETVISAGKEGASPPSNGDA